MRCERKGAWETKSLSSCLDEAEHNWVKTTGSPTVNLKETSVQTSHSLPSHSVHDVGGKPKWLPWNFGHRTQPPSLLNVEASVANQLAVKRNSYRQDMTCTLSVWFFDICVYVLSSIISSRFMSQDRHVLKVIEIDKLLEKMKTSNELLDLIQKVCVSCIVCQLRNSLPEHSIYRPYFSRPRKYRRLFSEPTYWPRRSRGQYGEGNNQAGIFEAEGNKSLIPGRLVLSPLTCPSTRTLRGESVVSLCNECCNACTGSPWLSGSKWFDRLFSTCYRQLADSPGG